MKLGVVAVLLALGGLPSSRAKLGRQPKSKTSAPQSDVKLGSMAANFKNAATESFLRAHLAADEKEIARQKERADSQDKLVDVLASRLDLEERRMARFIVRVTDLEKKANITAASAPQVVAAKGQTVTAKSPAKVPQVTMKLAHADVPATAAKALEAKHVASSTKSTPQKAAKAVAKNISQGSPKLPTVVKLAHSEIPATAAKALESKHVPTPAKQVALPSNSSASKSSDLEEDRIPEADTLTAADTQALVAGAKSDEVELSNEDDDEVDTALENEELGENDATQTNTVGKTAVVKLAHRTVPATSSSEDQAPGPWWSTLAAGAHVQAPVAMVSPPVTPPVETASAKKVVSVPPPPPPVAKVSAPPVPPAQVVAVPPAPKVSPPTDSIPPPPPAIADMSTADETADTADVADSNAEDVSAEDALEKDDEAASLADEPQTKPYHQVVSTSSDTSPAWRMSHKPNTYDHVVSTSSDTSSEVSGDSENADMDVANEEKEIDTEEAAVGDEGPSSASTGSELDDEQE